jgi:hypothetical protein
VTVELDPIVAELRSNRISHGGRLKPGGEKEVAATIQRWERERGLRAYVAVLPAGEDVTQGRALWDRLGLDSKRHLLLIANGKRWEARGWGLSAGRVQTALERATPGLSQYLGRGLAQALDELGALTVASAAQTGAARPQTDTSAPVTAEEPESSSTSIALGLLGTVAAGALGFVIYRRSKRAKEQRADYDSARASAERAFADLMLSSEELRGPIGAELQRKGAALKQSLDARIAETEGKPAKMSDPIVVGEIRQIESEFAALRSTGLQEAAAQSCSSQKSESTSPAPKPDAEWDPSNGSDLSSEQPSTSEAVRKN